MAFNKNFLFLLNQNIYHCIVNTLVSIIFRSKHGHQETTTACIDRAELIRAINKVTSLTILLSFGPMPEGKLNTELLNLHKLETGKQKSAGPPH